MEQRASSLQQRLEARRNMFLAGKTGDGGGGSGPPPVPGTQPAYISSRTGKWKNVSTIQSRNSNFIANLWQTFYILSELLLLIKKKITYQSNWQSLNCKK